MEMKDYLKAKGSRLLISALLLTLISSIAASLLFWSATADAQGLGKKLLHRNDARVQATIGVQSRHTPWLMGNPDVLGTGVGASPDGLPVIKVFAARHGVAGIPDSLESVPVQVEVTGMIVARENPAGIFGRPVPIGVSTGHPDITAGTIGARVRDAFGNVYALSNNHIYAKSNNAHRGDPVLQPGPADGGQNPADSIGTLLDFQLIDFAGGLNIMDAAIASSSKGELGTSTPMTDLSGNLGYGTPSSTTVPAAVGLAVQKYGRTTGMTHGQVSAINVTVDVCYEVVGIVCMKSAIFINQIAISDGTFSAGGDSGSLIVTDDANKNPVGLLFAGGSTQTFANPIYVILAHWGLSIDDGAASPPPPEYPPSSQPQPPLPPR